MLLQQIHTVGKWTHLNARDAAIESLEYNCDPKPEQTPQIFTEELWDVCY